MLMRNEYAVPQETSPATESPHGANANLQSGDAPRPEAPAPVTKLGDECLSPAGPRRYNKRKA